jgi:Sec-independent protein translocase protein TatA
MRNQRNIVRIPEPAPEVCLPEVCRPKFDWLARAGMREVNKTQEKNQEQQQQQQEQAPPNRPPGIPREFPGIVYRTLRFYPDAMKALARAIKEFYQGTYNPYADQEQQEPPKAA